MRGGKGKKEERKKEREKERWKERKKERKKEERKQYQYDQSNRWGVAVREGIK